MKPIERNIQDILAKKLAGELSAKENLYFETWLQDDDNLQLYKTLDRIELDCDYEQAMQIKDEVLNKTFNKIFSLADQQPQNKNRQIITFLSVAASTALLISFVSLYFIFSQEKENITMVTLSCPYGLSTITLPDSSTVTLNAGSTLTYPSRFDKSSRRVTLTGEAFFDVSHNPGQPFIVVTDLIDVKVLGTRFNMSAYSDDNMITTSLVSGSIELVDKKHDRLLKITPNQSADYNKQTEEIHLQAFDPEYTTGWVSGGIFFKKSSFSSISSMLERKFNCTIEIRNQHLEEKLFTGKFENNESLPQILNIIKINMPFNYSIRNNTVIIY